jgi:hypothetical protein
MTYSCRVSVKGPVTFPTTSKLACCQGFPPVGVNAPVPALSHFEHGHQATLRLVLVPWFAADTKIKVSVQFRLLYLGEMRLYPAYRREQQNQTRLVLAEGGWGEGGGLFVFGIERDCLLRYQSLWGHNTF